MADLMTEILTSGTSLLCYTGPVLLVEADWPLINKFAFVLSIASVRGGIKGMDIDP